MLQLEYFSVNIQCSDGHNFYTNHQKQGSDPLWTISQVSLLFSLESFPWQIRAFWLEDDIAFFTVPRRKNSALIPASQPVLAGTDHEHNHQVLPDVIDVRPDHSLLVLSDVSDVNMSFGHLNLYHVRQQTYSQTLSKTWSGTIMKALLPSRILSQ